MNIKKIKINEVNRWIFSECASKEIPEFINKFENVDDFLNANYNNMNILESGIYKVAGWAFDFSPYLKRYIVLEGRRGTVYYAKNKTLLRKAISTGCREVIEI